MQVLHSWEVWYCVTNSSQMQKSISPIQSLTLKRRINPLSARNPKVKMTSSQHTPRLPALPSLITFQFEAFVVSLSDSAQMYFYGKILHLSDWPLRELKSTISSSSVVSPTVAAGISSTLVKESNNKSFLSDLDFKWNDNKLVVPASSQADEIFVKKGSTWIKERKSGKILVSPSAVQVQSI